MKTTATTIAALLALAAAANAAHTATAPAARIPFMRGMNLCGFYGDYLENSTSADTPTSAQRYADLKAKGFDHIRLPVDFRKFANYDESSETCTLDKREWNRYAWKYVSSGWRRQPALGADHGPGSPQFRIGLLPVGRQQPRACHPLLQPRRLHAPGLHLGRCVLHEPGAPDGLPSLHAELGLEPG